MDGIIMRSVARYIVENKRGDRQSDGANKRTSKYPETEFDTNGVQRDGSGDERCNTDQSR